MIKYRIKRRGVEEWLASDGTPTKDERLAVVFDYYTSAIIFLLETLGEFDLWAVQPFRAGVSVEVAA